MERITLRVESENLEAVDEIVDDGTFPNRSEALREAIGMFVDEHGERERVLTDGGEDGD